MGIVNSIQEFKMEEELYLSFLKEGIELPEYIFKEKYDSFLFFDFSELFLHRFYTQICDFLKEINLSNFKMVMVDPNPESYYFKHFGYYGLIDFSVGQIEHYYLDLLFSAPEKSPADAIGDVGNSFILYSQNNNWVIYANRDYEVCIVAFKDFLYKEAFSNSFKFVKLFDVNHAIEELSLDTFSDKSQSDFLSNLVSNYSDIPVTQ